MKSRYVKQSVKARKMGSDKFYWQASDDFEDLSGDLDPRILPF